MSYPSSAGGQPPSFKTNVNRAKTKRWVEAKSYSYDGDDWGDMDEYDEYGGYDEPPPPPRPTGLRQRGQSANREQQMLYQSQQGGYNHPEAGQHGYGNIGRQGPPQQQYGVRSATNPPQQTPLARSGSFDQGDERRAFSAAYPHPGAPPQSGTYQTAPYAQSSNAINYDHPSGPPTSQSQQFQPGSVPPPASDYFRQPGMGSRTQSMTSNSSVDFHNRRDFSPSAVPPPLHTKGSPSPQSMPTAQSAWRPPRKSSLSQQNQPEFTNDNDDYNDSETQRRDTRSRERPENDSNKPLPFVRPADIYRRMQEEKQRERQSQESSRPSMDALTDDNAAGDDRQGNAGGTTDPGHNIDPRRRSKPILDPVAERKSEYGMAGSVQHGADHNDELAKQKPTNIDTPKPAEPRKFQDSLSPQLPDVARMSGFGELFADTTHPNTDSLNPSTADRSGSSQIDSHQPLENQSESTLQHQPSLGFRSVVHQAFDTTNEQIPETPSSNANSSIGRSGSGGTSIVSPIISRGPSSATKIPSFRDPQIRAATPPTIDEKLESEDRPRSSGSLGTPKAILRKASPDIANQRPASFRPGHRRDLSTPSPDNSPARTPAVEANRQLQQPQEAELAMTTPIETRFPHAHQQPDSPQSSRASPIKLAGNTKFPSSNFTRPENEPSVSPQPLSGETPKSPAESTRSRVRNLADKFESGRSSPAGSERAASPVKTSFFPNQITNQARPLAADRLESFRPKLPGGWESSASLAPLPASNYPEPSSEPIPLEQRLQDTATQSNKPTAASPVYISKEPERSHEGGSISPKNGSEAPASDPFASLAAAGSALAGAFSSAMGTEKDATNKSPSKESHSPADPPSEPTVAEEDPRMTRPRNTSVNTAFIPEASKSVMLPTPDDEASSIMPTPLDKLSQPVQSGQSKAGDYFAGSTTPKQQASGDSYTTQESASIRRLQLLPSLSTDTGPQYESDRLRREIIRELSPRLTGAPNAAGSDPQVQGHSRQSANPTLDAQQRESLVIPREYDSYWNDSSSERSSRASSVRGPSKAVRDAMSQYAQGPSVMSPAAGTMNQSPTTGSETGLTPDNFAERPARMPHRFSWEGPNEAISKRQEALPSERQLSDNRIRDDLHPDPRERTSVDNKPGSNQQAQHAPNLVVESHDASTPLDPLSDRHTMHTQTKEHSSEDAIGPDPGALQTSPTADQTAQDVPSSSTPSNLPLLDAGGEPHGNLGPYSAQEHSNSPSQSVGTTNDLVSLPGPSIAHPKIQSFREILALKDPQDRIRRYNHTREQFANADTGLSHWVAVTAKEFPEHSDVLSNGRFSGPVNHKASTTRTRLGGIIPGSSSGQQPYYQQYLNASSPVGAALDTSSATGGNSPQAYSPSSSGGKLSSQQMQARGKDLLHSAGVFGGKANVAAKGLFSKGKSRFRGGNTDKAPISTFNTDYKRDPEQQHQSSKSFPSTPQSQSFTEVSHSPEQSILDRPKSFAGPSAHPTHDASHSKEVQSPSSTLPFKPPPKSEIHEYGSSNDLGRTGDYRQPPLPNEPLLQKAANDTETSLQSKASEVPSLYKAQVQQGQQQSDQSRRVQSPHSLTSSNRTPTQADYVDYFRRGSSPTAIIPRDSAVGNGQRDFEDETAQKPSGKLQGTGLDSPPSLKSKYSNTAPREVPPIRANQMNFEPASSQSDQAMPQRGSEDSEGTFETAPTDNRTYLANAASRNHPDVPGVDPRESTGDLGTDNSSDVSSPPVSSTPVPAANIQDQTKARPFSFVQFSKSPVLRPFEDYARREPSIDSTASKIDPDQDVPPSPISSRQSVPHVQANQPGRRSPVHQGVGPEFVADNHQGYSSPRSQASVQPSQGSLVQERPAVRQEYSPKKEENMLEQHYQAPISRQDPVNPRKQATEYSLEGVGPPAVPQQTNSASTSKRGSRSSAFFRSFKNSAETTSPQLSSDTNGQDDIDAQERSQVQNAKNKRGSLFRSLTGAAKTNSSGENSEKSSRVEQPVHVQGDPQSVVDTAVNNENSTKAPSKYRNRLSRTATAKIEEQQQQRQEPGKKNRLSAIGSLFGKSKGQKTSTANLDRPQQVSGQMQQQDQRPLQDRNSRMSSSTGPGRGSAIPPENPANYDEQYQYTRNKLAREGFLSQGPMPKPSKVSEPSAYNQDSTQRQQQFPPRHQSLGREAPRDGQRPSNWSREPSSTSSKVLPQQNIAPKQQHRLQSSVTTTSTTRSSGLRQPDTKPRQLSTMTTTTTTMSRTPNSMPRHQSVGNSYSRSDSPPPPAPPPKDTWHQPKPHQRSTSNNSFNQTVRISNEIPPYVTKNNGNLKTNRQATQAVDFPPQPTDSSSPPLTEARHSLPPLQTNIPSPPSGPKNAQGASTADPNTEARRRRQSQIESAGTPKAEQARTLPAPVAASPLIDVRNKARKSWAESDDEPIVMSATSFPGQEWQPSSFARWEGD